MPNVYRVKVCRSVHGNAEVEVQAKNRGDAEILARNLAGTYEYTDEKDSIFHWIDSVSKVRYTPPLKKYTVVGYYASNNQTASIHVMSPDEIQAVANIPGTIDGGDFIVVDIFEGHLHSRNENYKTSCACDWLGW